MVRSNLDGRPVWQRDYAELMGCVGFRTKFLQAAAPLCQGQDRAADQVHEGQLPRGKGLHRHHRPQQGRSPVVRRSGRQVATSRRLRACGGARGRLPRLSPQARGDRGGRALAVPEAQDNLRRVRRLREQALRHAIPVRPPQVLRSREGRVLCVYSDDLSRKIVAYTVTWGRGDSWCDGQRADEYPEGLPGQPLTAQIAQVELSASKPALAKFDFRR